METDRAPLLATMIVIGTGALWGFYWLPVRALTDRGLSGAWGTLAITVAAVVVLSPVAFARWQQIVRADRVALLSIALGGGAFALYSIGFVYGRVAIIILLYFLTPVWSTLIARYGLGWQTTYQRLVAIGLGLAGLTVILSADGQFPVPRGAGEWMGLMAGVLWSVATTGIRTRSDLPAMESAFVFALGASLVALALAPLLEPWPKDLPMSEVGSALGLAVLSGGLWWGLSIASLMWATVRLEPAQVGILLMAEVLFGAASAAVLVGEHLSLTELLGGALVLCAGVLEALSGRKAPPAR